MRRGAHAGAAIAATLLCAAPAWAQHNGDVRGGMNNQPTKGEVRSREQADGVAPPPVQQQRETGAVDQLYRNLMGKERADGITTAPANPNAPMTPAPAAPAR